MDIEDMAWYGQWTSKMFGEWTLKNILNDDDNHIRIFTIVPDASLDTYPEILIKQCSRVSVPVDVQTLDQNTWSATIPATTTQLHGNE